MTCLVKDVIEELKCDLSDPKGKIWSDKRLLDYIRQAVTHIVTLRPDAFSTRKEVALTPGTCDQSFCDECSDITSIISIDGQDCTPPDEDSSNSSLTFLNSYFSSSDCSGPNDGVFNPGGYTPSDDCECCFRLDEPAPTDREVLAVISCVDPDILDFDLDGSLPEKICTRFYEGFMHLVKHKAYLIDQKSEVFIELAKQHRESWTDFRDWEMRTAFANDISSWHIYRERPRRDG